MANINHLWKRNCMATAAELRHLLSLVQFDTRLNGMKGRTAFRQLLEHDSGGSVVRFLNRELPTLEGLRWCMRCSFVTDSGVWT